MAVPSGRIVERPMLARACGCVREFQVYEVDRFRAQRQAKFQSTRCPECAARYVASQRATLPPKKGEAFAALPAGAEIILTRQADGSWAGTLSAAGTEVTAEAVNPQTLTAGLAQLWVTARREA